MAEIPLQQKEKRNPLPLILLALAVLALLAWFFMRDRSDVTARADSTAATPDTSVRESRMHDGSMNLARVPDMQFSFPTARAAA